MKTLWHVIFQMLITSVYVFVCVCENILTRGDKNSSNSAPSVQSVPGILYNGSQKVARIVANAAKRAFSKRAFSLSTDHFKCHNSLKKKIAHFLFMFIG